jgi:transcriptional regulator EpsA
MAIQNNGVVCAVPSFTDRRRSDCRRQTDLMPLLASLGRTNSRIEFIAWCREALSRYLPHGAFICCLGKVEADGKRATPIESLAHEFPLEFVHGDLCQPGNFRANIMRYWLGSGEPILANSEDVARIINDPDGLTNFHAGGLCNIAAHGMHDFTRVYVSHFSFHKIPEHLEERHARILEILVPPMHAAMIRVAHQQAAGEPLIPPENPRLTQRELEILGWISSGKTNEDISIILGTRFKTVKNQVQSILVKLRVNNRAQAVAKAAKLGLHLGLHDRGRW